MVQRVVLSKASPVEDHLEVSVPRAREVHLQADLHSLHFYNIVAGSTVWMVMRLRGGMDAGALVVAII